MAMSRKPILALKDPELNPHCMYHTVSLGLSRYITGALISVGIWNRLETPPREPTRIHLDLGHTPLPNALN